MQKRESARLNIASHLFFHAVLVCAVFANTALAAKLTEKNIAVESEPRSTRVRIELDEPVDVRVADQMEEGAYFFVDLYGVQPDFTDHIISVSDGVLKRIQTLTYPDLNVFRLVFYPAAKTIFRVADLRTGHIYDPVPVNADQMPGNRQKTTQLVIDTSQNRFLGLPPLTPSESVLTEPAKAEVLSQKPAGPGKSVKRLVVLDPGHGGRDPGALSALRFGGEQLQEKDIVLAITKEVQRLLNNSPNVSAVLTRERDEYMSLRDRVRFTERLNANLFVSIHANSDPKRKNTSRGVEFYYLGPNTKAEVRALVAAENTEPSQELNEDENEVRARILKMLTKDYMQENRGLSSIACQHFEQVFNKDIYFRYYNRGVKSAPFRVLANPTTPAVLIEVGFINHDRESRNLAHPAFQRRIATRIANGVLQYFAQLDSEFEYYQYQID